MLFRHLLTQNYSVGKRGQHLSKRSLSKTDLKLQPLILIDVSYLSFILESKHKSKQSKLYNALDENTLQILRKNPKFLTLKQKRIIYYIREAILGMISDITSLIRPEYIILIYGSSETLVENLYIENIVNFILQPFQFNSYTLQNNTFSDFLFSYCQSLDKLSKYNIISVTNSITAWACNSHTTQMGYIAFSKNLRPLYYNNKTGIDIVCKFINTSKIVNKLNIDELKYINLQYLYLLILYTKFMHHIDTDKKFYFDAKYFKDVKKIDYSVFLNSNGLGLQMITEAHKSLSYIFLTKPDLMDQFLFYNTTTFLLNMQRLLKITKFDTDFMSYFSNYYCMTDMLRKLPLPEIPLSSIYDISVILPNLYPKQYEDLLKTLHARKIPELCDKKSPVHQDTTSDISSGVSDAIGNILRRLLW